MLNVVTDCAANNVVHIRYSDDSFVAVSFHAEVA